MAEDETGLVGFATSFVRDTTWCLATYVVRPGLQGRGIGRSLLDAAMEHGRACLHGMLSASTDPKALRRYHQAGFALHPHMRLAGQADRSAIPVVEKVREGSAGDIDLANSVDRQVRGAAHGPDHEYLLRHHRMLVSDSTTGSGYAFLGNREMVVVLLAATNRRTASRLLWAALADSPAGGAGHHPARHGGQRLGDRCRHGGSDGPAPGRLPGAAGDETALAVPPQRRAPLRLPRRTLNST